MIWRVHYMCKPKLVLVDVVLLLRVIVSVLIKWSSEDAPE